MSEVSERERERAGDTSTRSGAVHTRTLSRTRTCAASLKTKVVHAQHSAVCPVLPAFGRLMPFSVTSHTLCLASSFLKYVEEMDGPG